jgi:hypothetical protein
VGYYVSLLAEARGHKVIPSVRTINDLRRRSLYGVDIEDLNAATGQVPAGRFRDTTDFGMLVYFGETSYAPLKDLARQVFEAFPCPILRIEFERQRVWQIAAIKPAGLNTLCDSQEDAFAAALDAFSRKTLAQAARAAFVPLRHRNAAGSGRSMPPSNRKALKHFIEAGKELGIEVDPVTRNDLRAPGRVRRPVHPRDHRAGQPHLPLRATAPRRKTWW